MLIWLTTQLPNEKEETFFVVYFKIILLSLVVLEFHLLKILPCLSMGTSAEETKKWTNHRLPLPVNAL